MLTSHSNPLPTGLSEADVKRAVITEQLERASRSAGQHCVGTFATGIGAVAALASLEGGGSNMRPLLPWVVLVTVAVAGLFEVLIRNRRTPAAANTVDATLLVVAATGLIVGSVGWFNLSAMQADGYAFAVSAVVIAFCAGSLVALNPLAVLIGASVVPALVSTSAALILSGHPVAAGCTLAVLAIILSSLPNMRANVSELVRAHLVAVHASQHDPMTQVLNRAGLALHTRPGAVVTYIDVDNFKSINDQHGHAIGDQVLCEVAMRLRAVAERSDGVVSRVGGDEFVIVHQHDTVDQQHQMMKQLATAIGAPYSDVGYVNLSFGTAVIEGDHNLSNALSEADQALFRAKRKDDLHVLRESATFDQRQITHHHQPQHRQPQHRQPAQHRAEPRLRVQSS